MYPVPKKFTRPAKAKNQCTTMFPIIGTSELAVPEEIISKESMVACGPVVDPGDERLNSAEPLESYC